MASVLETFYLLFESNAKEAAADLDKVEQSSDGVSESLSETASQATEANESFTDMIGKLKGVVAGYVGLKTVQAALDLANHVDILGKTADMWGKNVSQIDAWGQAAARNGGSLDGFISSMDSLNSGLSEIAMTGEGALLPFLNLFGISALDASGKARDAFDILPDIADQFERLTSSEQVALGRQLGLDDATIRMLQMGRRELDLMIKKQQRLGVVTKEETEAAAAFNNSLADTSQIFGTLGRKILTAAMPFMTAFADIMTEFFVFLNQNQSLVEGFFIGLTALMIPFAVSAIASAAPFIAMGAAIMGVVGAIALVHDEMKNWIAGNDSLLGRLFGSWDQYATKLYDIFDRIKEGAGAVGRFLGFGDDDDIASGQSMLSTASNSGVAAVTSGAIANSAVSNSGGNISIGEVKVETQSTDADGIASDIGNSLKKQMRATVDTFDDGTKA